MKKTIGILCTLAALIALASNPFIARAANNGEIIEAYCQGNNLYTYSNLSSAMDASDLTVQARIGKELYEVIKPALQQVSKSSVPVSYLFMIDISTSMPAFKANVDRFVESILDTAQGNASFLVTTFGESFEPMGDFSNDRETVLETVKGIRYNANQTSLYTGIMDAIYYYNQKERAEGELYNLIIISDGIEVDKNGPTENEVKEQISKSTPIIIHTFGLSTAKTGSAAVKASEEALKVLGAFSRATLGKHTTYGRDKLTEAQLAGKITDYINHLYLAKFNLFMHTPVGNTFDLGLLFSSTGETIKMFRLDKTDLPYLKATAKADVSAENGNGISGDNTDGTQDPEDGNTDSTQNPEDGSTDDTQKPGDGNADGTQKPGDGNSDGTQKPEGGNSDDAQKPEGGDADGTQKPEGSDTDDAQKPEGGDVDGAQKPEGGNSDDAQKPEGGDADGTQDPEGDDTQAPAGNDTAYRDVSNPNVINGKLWGINIYLLILAPLALLLFCLLIIYFLKRKKAVPVDNNDHKIYMKLEVISGKCSTQKRDFYLADEFIIGRGKKCHIPFKDKEVSKRNSRVFLRDNMIYIEDFNSTNGTAISGMKIHAPNRLRSCDEISIGTVKFRLKF